MRTIRDSDISRLEQGNDAACSIEAVSFTTADSTTVEWRLPFGNIVANLTPYGITSLDITSRRKATALDFQSQQAHPDLNPKLLALISQIEYRLRFQLDLTDIPLNAHGTTFQMLVWHHLRTIKPGTIQSYSEVALAIGHPKAVRAVANACARNAVALAIPCHRVIRSDGSLGGYRWGLSVKKDLLYREKARISSSRPEQ